MSLERFIQHKQAQQYDENAQATVDSRMRLQKKKEIATRTKEKIADLRDEVRGDSREDIEKKIRAGAFSIIDSMVEREYAALMISQSEKHEILERVMQDLFGFGVIEPLLKNPAITEIMINGPKRVFVEQKGKITRAKDKLGHFIEFSSERELRNMIDKIVAPINRKVDESDPIVDARLPDGSRVNVVLNSISLGGTTVTIRKFPEHPFTLDQLVTLGSLPEHVAALLKKMVRARYNILVSGGTGSGKTTFLNALSQHIQTDARVITAEDSAELKFDQVENLIRMETRPPNIEGKGAITMRDLVKTALRMRPDRIVVGEVRSGEALDMLQAMNTGHDGSLSTGHANSADDMLLRLETMVLMAGMDLPVKAIRQQIASAVDIIVQLSKLRDGSRRVVEIIEVLGMDGEEIVTQPLFLFEETIEASTIDKVSGNLVYTNHPLQQTTKFYTAGESDYELFFRTEASECCLSVS